MVSQPRALPSSFSSELVGMLSRFEHLEIFFGRQYASRHVLQPELPCCFPQDALTLLFDELPQGLQQVTRWQDKTSIALTWALLSSSFCSSSSACDIVFNLRPRTTRVHHLLLLLVHLATLLDEPLDLAFVLQHLHPPPLRIHLLDTLVLGKLGEHSLSEFFFFRLLLLQLLQLQLLLVFVGCLIMELSDAREIGKDRESKRKSSKERRKRGQGAREGRKEVREEREQVGEDGPSSPSCLSISSQEQPCPPVNVIR
mmetsp:Transcript_41552/g.130963  ORF Transcript_41552/g.130963 Transcript_41552/m.130963 type:complete len:256 (-) Transcript_41552:49-816(-)